MKKLCLIFCTIVFMSSCKTQTAPFQLSFGSGGGFTGNYTTYSLSNDGKIIKTQTLDTTKTQVAALSKKQVAALATQITKVNFDSININNPGNMSNFVNLKRGTSQYKTLWSGNTSGNAALDELFKTLNSFITNK